MRVGLGSPGSLRSLLVLFVTMAKATSDGVEFYFNRPLVELGDWIAAIQEVARREEEASRKYKK